MLLTFAYVTQNRLLNLCACASIGVVDAAEYDTTSELIQHVLRKLSSACAIKDYVRLYLNRSLTAHRIEARALPA